MTSKKAINQAATVVENAQAEIQRVVEAARAELDALLVRPVEPSDADNG